MALPRVSVTFSNGNLLADKSVVDGIAGIVGTVVTVGLQGQHKIVYNLKDAESKGYTSVAEPAMHRHIREFYAELGGNQELHVLGLAPTVTMETMLDVTNASGAMKLAQLAEGRVRLIGVVRTPPGGYAPGANYLDADVSAAVTKALAFGQAQLAALRPCRVLIEGRVNDEASTTIYEPKSAANGFAAVVLGGSKNDKSAGVGMALGRAVKYPAHIKVGKVANGPLSATAMYIGTKLIKEVLNLDTLADKGYLVPMQHPMKAGFYYGIDAMCSDDDYRLLANGRVIDKACVIAASTYIDQLESEVETEDDGTIREDACLYLEALVRQQVLANMAGQLSDVVAIVDRTANIINTSRCPIRIRVRPLGYLSYIDVDLGLMAGN